MSAAIDLVDQKLLKNLVPLNGLSKAHFDEVTQKGSIEEFRAGKIVFKEGIRDGQTYFLLNGEVSLQQGRDAKNTVSAGSEEALHPLAAHQPRQFTARANTQVTLLRIDSGLLDVLLAWDQSASYEVTDIQSDDDQDWMTRMLQSELFLQLPATNIQQMIMRMEAVAVSAGQVVVEQDDEGDYYYIIQHGKASVSRRPSAKAKPVTLAELKDGDSFGEESLVSGGKRNATVTMVTDGALMRLAKSDFEALLREPMLNQVSYKEACRMIDRGAAWLDVRLPGEYQNAHLPGSINVPLAAVRESIDQLPQDHPLIVCCDTGTRSSGAAFLLTQRGLHARVLKGGLAAVAHDDLVSAASASPDEVLGAEIIEFKDAPAGAKGDHDALPSVSDQQERPAATEELLQAQARLSELSSTLDKMTAARTTLKAELIDNEKRAGEKLDELHDQLKAVQGELREEQAAHESARTAIKQLEHNGDRRAQELSDRIRTLEAEHAQLEASLLDQVDASEQGEIQAHERDQALAALQADKDALEQRLNDQRAEHEQALRTALEQDETQTHEREQALAALQADKDALEQRLNDQRAEHEQALQAALEQAGGETAELRSARERAEAQSAELQAAHEQALRELMEQAEARTRERDQALAMLQADKDALEQQLNDQRAEHEQALQAALEQAGGETAELQSARERAEAQNAELHAAHEQALHELMEQAEARTRERDQALAVLQADKDALEQQLNDQRAEHEQALQAALEQAGGETAELQSARERAEAQSAELQAAHEQALRAATEQAEIQTRERDQALAALQADKDVLEQQLTDQRATHEQALRTALEQAEAQNAELQAAHEQALRAATEQAEAQNAELQAAHEQALRAATEQAEIQTRERDQALAVLQVDKDALEKRLLERGEAQAAALGEELRAAQAETEQANVLLQANEQALHEARNQSDSMARVLSEREQKIDALAQEGDRLEQELRERTEALSSAEQAHALLAQDLAARNESSDRGVEELQQRLQALEKQTGTLDEQLRERTKALSSAEQELEELRQERADADRASGARLHKLGDELDSLRREYEELQQHSSSTQRKYDEVQREHDRVAAELHELQAGADVSTQDHLQRNATLEADNAKLIDEIEALREQAGALTVQHADSESAQHEASNELLQLKRENESLAAQLAQAVDEADSLRQRALELGRESEMVAEENLDQVGEEIATIRAQADKELQQAGEEISRMRRELDQGARHTDRAERKLQETLNALRAAEHRIKAMESELALTRQMSAGDSGFHHDLSQVQRDMQAHLVQYKAEADAIMRQAREENTALKLEIEQLYKDGRRSGDVVEDGVVVAEIPARGVADDGAADAKANDITGGRLDPTIGDLADVFDLTDADVHLHEQEQADIRYRRARRFFTLTVVLVLGAVAGAGIYWYVDRSTAPDSAQLVRTLETQPPPVAAKKTAKPAPSMPNDTKTVQAASVAQAARAPALPANIMKPGRTYQDFLADGSAGPVMVQVPPGSFAMGSRIDSPHFSERPRHTVTLPGFSISRDEVTFAEYDRFADATGRTKPDDSGWGRDQRPVVNVSWDDAVAYAQWLSQQTGRRYRLPTEAEWEYAARAGTSSTFWWGDVAGKGRADCFNCGSRWDGHRTAPVGSFAANALGLHDTAGNVMEWTEDCFHDNYDGAPSDDQAWTNPGCRQHVARGGSYRTPSENLRSTKRYSLPADTRVDYVGFRLARER